MVHTIEIDVAGRTLRLETGRVAKQADGAVWASYGDTVVLATSVAAQTAKPGIDFLPLRSLSQISPFRVLSPQ